MWSCPRPDLDLALVYQLLPISFRLYPVLNCWHSWCSAICFPLVFAFLVCSCSWRLCAFSHHYKLVTADLLNLPYCKPNLKVCEGILLLHWHCVLLGLPSVTNVTHCWTPVFWLVLTAAATSDHYSDLSRMNRLFSLRFSGKCSPIMLLPQLIGFGFPPILLLNGWHMT